MDRHKFAKTLNNLPEVGPWPPKIWDILRDLQSDKLLKGSHKYKDFVSSALFSHILGSS